MSLFQCRELKAGQWFMMYYANNFIHKWLMNEDIFNVDFFWSCLLSYKVTLVDILLYMYWIFWIKKIQDISQKEGCFFSQVRINQELEHFLINPFGLNYGEITASSLVKVDMQGDVIEKGTTTLGINRAGFTLHSAIHQARPDLKCVIHLHTPAAVAVSPRPVLVDSVLNQCCTGNDFKGRLSWHWYMPRVYKFIKGIQIN